MRKICRHIILVFVSFLYVNVLWGQSSLSQTPELNDDYPVEIQLRLAQEYFQEGVELFNMNELKNAEIKLDNAYQIFFKNDQLEDAAEVLLKLALLYHEADFDEKSERILKQVNAIWSALDMEEKQLKTIDFLARFQLEKKNFKLFNNYTLLLFRKASALNDSLFIGKSYFYWGEWYLTINPDSSIFYYQRAISQFNTSKMEELAYTYARLAKASTNAQQALKYITTALKLFKELNDHENTAACQIELGKNLIQNKQYELAKENLMKALSISNSFQLFENLIEANLHLADLHEALQDYKLAALYYNQSIAYSDSFLLLQKQAQLRFLKDKYDIHERDKMLRTKETELKIEIEKAQSSHLQKLVLVILVVFILLSVVSLFILSRKKQANNNKLAWENAEILSQNEEILTQKEELERLLHYLEEQSEEILTQNTSLEAQNNFANEQKKQIESLQSEIMLNIGFAVKLQVNLLPSERKMRALLKDYFIVYYPQSYISGDFYWVKKIDSERIIFAVADSTGHGMPGALMSVLGLSFLNEIVAERPVKTAAEVLSELRRRIKIALRSASGETARDGYDIGLCILSTQTLELQYAGAYNPLYIVRNRVLEKIAANRFPAGLYLSFEKPFTNHSIQLKNGDMLYLFSDGLADQFGGEFEKKFTGKRLKNLLIDCSDLALADQREIITEQFMNWKGDLAQTDDVVFLGVRV